MASHGRVPEVSTRDTTWSMLGLQTVCTIPLGQKIWICSMAVALPSPNSTGRLFCEPRPAPRRALRVLAGARPRSRVGRCSGR